MELLPYAPERDVYRLLQVDPRASQDEVLAACRRLAKAFHPDRNGSTRAHLEMQVVNAVRGLLADPGTRAEYDRQRWVWHASSRVPRRPISLAGGAGASVAAAPATGAPPLLATTVRYGRATLAGLRAAIGTLVPERCVACRAAAGRHDRSCGVCGATLSPPVIR